LQENALFQRDLDSTQTAHAAHTKGRRYRGRSFAIALRGSRIAPESVGRQFLLPAWHTAPGLVLR